MPDERALPVTGLQTAISEMGRALLQTMQCLQVRVRVPAHILEFRSARVWNLTLGRGVKRTGFRMH